VSTKGSISEKNFTEQPIDVQEPFTTIPKRRLARHNRAEVLNKGTSGGKRAAAERPPSPHFNSTVHAVYILTFLTKDALGLLGSDAFGG
jgi:hypothetical protein